MPKLAAAEWFLSLFTTRDRASAIAGDLFEQPRASWLDVLRTAGALFLRSVAAQPWRLALLVLLGAFLRVAAAQVYGLPIRFGFFTSYSYRVVAYWRVADSIVAPLLIGYVIARLARGREIAACLAYVIVQALFTLSTPFWCVHCTVNSVCSTLIFGDVVPALFLLGAAALTRKRALTRQLGHAGSSFGG